jgi:hypothetical protein
LKVNAAPLEIIEKLGFGNEVPVLRKVSNNELAGSAMPGFEKECSLPASRDQDSTLYLNGAFNDPFKESIRGIVHPGQSP